MMKPVQVQVAEERLEAPRPGDTILTDNRDRRYRVENLVDVRSKKTGGRLVKMTMVREVPKVRGKAARKAEKRARRLAR